MSARLSSTFFLLLLIACQESQPVEPFISEERPVSRALRLSHNSETAIKLYKNNSLVNSNPVASFAVTAQSLDITYGLVSYSDEKNIKQSPSIANPTFYGGIPGWGFEDCFDNAP